MIVGSGLCEGGGVLERVVLLEILLKGEERGVEEEEEVISISEWLLVGPIRYWDVHATWVRICDGRETGEVW
jgi:hypothetical protein